jgi:hypothetical protein
MGSKCDAGEKRELAYMPLEDWRVRKGEKSRAAPRALQCRGVSWWLRTKVGDVLQWLQEANTQS